MKEDKSIFKKGIWIREESHVLTMGEIGADESAAFTIPPELAEQIYQMEEEMVEAIYGDSAVAYTPSEGVNIMEVIDHAAASVGLGEHKISVKCAEEIFLTEKAAVVEIIFRNLIRNSKKNVLHIRRPGHIKIDASMLVGNLCILYRDGSKESQEKNIGETIDMIRSGCGGDFTSKKTDTGVVYFDMVIPVE